MKTTDIHTHMFNLKYLPVAGIVRRYSNGNVSKKMANGLERCLIKKTQSSFEETKFQAGLRRLRESISGVFRRNNLPEPIFPSDLNLFKLSKNELITRIKNRLNISDLMETEISEALLEFQEIQPGNANRKINFAAELAASGNASELLIEGQDMCDKMLNWIFDQIEKAMEEVDGGVSMIRWFAFMLKNEEDIYKRISEKDALGVARYLHLTMDVDYFFTESDGTPHHSYFDFVEKQIPNMAQLNANHSDKLVGFVAFNPSRANWRKIIEDALTKKGFKGVKFYPPLGYRADGDDNNNTVFIERIDALFKYCSENDIPIFTHCNNKGFEAYPITHSGYNSNPVHWEKALKRYPKLRICLAHGGGTEGWFSPIQQTDHLKAADIKADDIKDEGEVQEKNWNNSYAAMVFKLCVEHDNVYCDAAYLDDLVKSQTEFGDDDTDEKAKIFKDRLLKLYASEPIFPTKIIYGSDWHMLFQESKNEVYYKTYTDFYNEIDFGPYRIDFFENNAKRYLKF